ncbi:helix-turn-helix domain-containing protein [Methylobacterium sp. A49B]
MRLTDYLREHKLTHTGFAAKIGATQAAVTRYVNGRRKPSLDKLLVIERVTGGAVQARDFADQPLAENDVAAPVEGAVA